MALLRRYPRLTAAAAVWSAVVIFGAAVAGGVVLWGHRVLGSGHSCPYGATRYECFYHPRPGWVYPAELGILVLGLGGAAGVLVTAHRSTVYSPSPEPARGSFRNTGSAGGLVARQYSVMPYPRQGFVEIGLRPLDEPMVCHGCGAEVTEARVMERHNLTKTFWLYDCPNCGENLRGTRAQADASRPA
jgi:hypothetical protein